MGIQKRISAIKRYEQVCGLIMLLWLLCGEESGGGEEGVTEVVRPIRATAIDQTGDQGAWTQKVAMDTERSGQIQGVFGDRTDSCG